MLNKPHRRLNPLTGEYVLVSPHRTQRPWQGKQEATPQDRRPAHDPACYLCPGNTRAGGVETAECDGKPQRAHRDEAACRTISCAVCLTISLPHFGQCGMPILAKRRRR